MAIFTNEILEQKNYQKTIRRQYFKTINHIARLILGWIFLLAFFSFSLHSQFCGLMKEGIFFK
jgi:hypothetical protein